MTKLHLESLDGKDKFIITVPNGLVNVDASEKNENLEFKFNEPYKLVKLEVGS